MHKRQFLSHSTRLLMGAAAATVLPAQAKSVAPATQIILTVAGAVQHTNRGPSDAVTDQLMHKQGIHFDHAYQFTLAELEKLPATTIRPTMEYDGRQHALSGPRLLDLLQLVGADHVKNIVMHGIDGYSPEVTFGQAQRYDLILATHLDGKLLHIGGFGPLFAIYDADRIPELAQKPLDQRFVSCPWGLYCIELS